MRKLVLTTLFALLALLSSSVNLVEAKTPGYILTGGDLGEYAMHFYTDDALHAPNPEAVEVSAHDAAIPAPPYLLYSTWPFTAGREVAEGRPLALLYAEERLVHVPESGTWLKLSDRMWSGAESRSGVGRAIDLAKARLGRGELPKGPVLGAFVGREYDSATYLVTMAEGGPYRILGAGFPLQALADVLSAPPRTSTVDAQETPPYLVYATPREVGTHLLFSYAPPSAGKAGVIRPADRTETAYWESAPEFDRLFAEAERQPLFTYGQRSGPADASGTRRSYDSGSFPARTVSLLLVPLMVVVALGGLAGLAMNLRRGLRERRSR